ncbi:MAG: hypothetical protein HYT79_10890 [Elusimicrobia bacterium]|nr:hypothetical protein [Elusimicrobiota bacterium]
MIKIAALLLGLSHAALPGASGSAEAPVEFSVLDKPMGLSRQELDQVFARVREAQQDNAFREYKRVPLRLASADLSNTGVIHAGHIAHRAPDGTPGAHLIVTASQPYSRVSMVKAALKMGFSNNAPKAMKQALFGPRPENLLNFAVSNEGKTAVYFTGTVSSNRFSGAKWLKPVWPPLSVDFCRDAAASVLRHLRKIAVRTASRI